MRYLFIFSLFCLSSVFAQYEPMWEYEFRFPNITHVIGLGNTDNDPQPELVVKQEEPWLDHPYQLIVFDLLSGEEEWVSDEFYRIYTEPEKGTRLVDVDGDGILEILLLVEEDPGEQMWILYKYYGGAGKREDRYTPQRRVRLSQNSPNPFRKSTVIEYEIPSRQKVVLKIFDASGRIVKEFDCGEQEPGRHKVIWRRENKDGEKLPPGVYFYLLKSDGKEGEKKAIVIE